MVRQLERLARGERVRGVPLVDLDRQAPAAKAEPEGEPGQVLRQPGCEAQLAVMIAHSTQTGDGGRSKRPASEILAGIGLAF